MPDALAVEEADRSEVPAFPLCVLASLRLCVENICPTGTATMQNLTQRRKDARTQRESGLAANTMFPIWLRPVATL